MKDLQSEIESITQDSDIDQEEKDTLRNPFGLEQLYLQETYSLINKSIFCAILVFGKRASWASSNFYGKKKITRIKERKCPNGGSVEREESAEKEKRGFRLFEGFEFSSKSRY